MKQCSKVFAHDIFHGNVVEILQMTQIKDLDDVLVSQQGGQLGLIDKHRDEFGVLGKMGKNPLDGHDLFKALKAALLGEVDLGHTAGAYFIDEKVFPEMLWWHRNSAHPY